MTEDVERSDDGRYVIVNGRRWRASDPSIPDSLRAELVAELMSARRAVRTDGESARARVQDAKVALGERGEPWWEHPSESGLRDRVRSAIRTLLRHRSPDSSICPSDAARVAGGPQWRSAMDAARAEAAALHRAGVVRVQQGGRDVDPATAKGAIRIVRGSDW